MASRYRAIAPALSRALQTGGDLPDEASITAVACGQCRHRKIKCDKKRPACRRCVRIGAQCLYDADAGESHVGALKRQNAELRVEMDQLSELLNLMRTSSMHDANVILNRLRSSSNSAAQVLQDIRQAQGLLPETLGMENQDPRLKRLDEEAFRRSSIRVPARPWTAIVGDGVVSELVSAFFDNDDGYLTPFIHKRSFVSALRGQSPRNNPYCTPTLLNAVCAFKSLTTLSARTRGFLVGQSMPQQFLDEAKKQLDHEGCRPSLATVQALSLMYLTSALLGRDRAGIMYRYAAYEMLKRLDLAAEFEKLDSKNPTEAETRLVLSKALWGSYCFETRMSYFYSEPSLILAPAVPNLIDDEKRIDEDGPERQESPLAMSSKLWMANCTLCELFNEIMIFNVACTLGPDADANISQRTEFYTRLMELKGSWQPILPDQGFFTAQSCYFANHINEAAYSILQVLPSRTRLAGQSGTVRDLCIAHCKIDNALVMRYLQVLPPDPLLGRTLFVCLNILVPYLAYVHDPGRRRSEQDIIVEKLFVENSFMLRACLPITPMVKVLLQAIFAKAMSLGRTIPAAASSCFEGLDEMDASEDLPMSFSLPHSLEIRALLSGESAEVDRAPLGIQLSTIISRWSALSLK